MGYLNLASTFFFLIFFMKILMGAFHKPANGIKREMKQLVFEKGIHVILRINTILKSGKILIKRHDWMMDLIIYLYEYLLRLPFPFLLTKRL